MGAALERHARGTRPPGRPLDDATLAAYLAARFFAKLGGQSSPSVAARLTLSVRNWLHRKGLLVGFRDSRHNRANYLPHEPFRYLLMDPINPSRLLQA